jgi:hypothetical protein
MLRRSNFDQQPEVPPALPPPATPNYTPLEQWAGFRATDSSQRRQMPQLIIDIALTRDGRDLVEAEHHEFAHNVTGPTSMEISTAKAFRYAYLLARVAPNSVALVRASISELDDKGQAIEGASYSIPLDLNGLFAVPNGVKLAPRANVLRYEKISSVKGRPGRFDIRGFLTAPELAAFLADKTLPGRFLVGGATEQAPGTFIEAFMAAATDGALKLAMPSVKINDVLTARPISSLRLAGVKQTRATRVTKSVRAKWIQVAQQAVNELGSEAQFIRDNAPTGPLTAAEAAKINILKVKAQQIIDKLDDSYKNRVKMPESLA